MPISAPPTPPSRNDPTNFSSRADTFFAWFSTFVTEVNASIDTVAALTSTALSAASTATAASQAAQSAGIKWSAGTFNDGDVRWSPTNGQSYRKNGNGAGATDPGINPAGWWRTTCILIPRDVTGTSTTAAAFERLYLTNGSLTAVTLPASPNDGDEIVVIPKNGLFTNQVLRNGKTINGVADDFALDSLYFAYRFVYRAAGNDWSMTYA